MLAALAPHDIVTRFVSARYGELLTPRRVLQPRRLELRDADALAILRGFEGALATPFADNSRTTPRREKMMP